MGQPLNDPAPVDSPPVVPVPPVAPPAPTPPAFDRATASPELKAYLDAQDAEHRRLIAEADTKARTTSKANAAKEAEAALLAKLGLKPDDKPDDIATAKSDRDRLAAENLALQINGRVESAARSAGADDDLMVAYLGSKGRLAGLDPAAADFADKVKALVDAAVVEKPSLKLATGAIVVTPGSRGPGGVTAGNGGPAGEPPKRLGLAGAIAAAMNKTQ